MAALKGCDVLLVECHLPDRNESGTTSAFRAQFEVLVAAAWSIGAGICVVIREDSESARELLDLGADSIAFVDQSAALLAFAVFTAHNGALTRRLLTKKVQDLEQKLEHDRCVQQAKSILAEQMKITEGAALRHLRKEARDQRKSMVELAGIIIEAHRSPSHRLVESQGDAKATKVSRICLLRQRR